MNAFRDGTNQFSGYRHTVRVKFSMLRADGMWAAPQVVKFAEGGGTSDSRVIEDPLDDSRKRALELLKALA